MSYEVWGECADEEISAWDIFDTMLCEVQLFVSISFFAAGKNLYAAAFLAYALLTTYVHVKDVLERQPPDRLPAPLARFT